MLNRWETETEPKWNRNGSEVEILYLRFKKKCGAGFAFLLFLFHKSFQADLDSPMCTAAALKDKA